MVKIVRKTTKGDISRAILSVVKNSSIITTAIIAPNVILALKKSGITPHAQQNSVIARARNNLIKRGLLKNDNGYLRLTNTGEEMIRSYELANYILSIPRTWDHKWRVLIFDIPEQRKTLRNKVRNTLISIGFKRVQDSVWIYPYDCSEFISLLKADFKIGKDLLHMVVSDMENDLSLRKHFSLN